MPGKTVHEKNVSSPNQKMTDLLLLSSGEGIYGVNLNGDCTFCNPKGLELFGYSDETELLGKNMHSLIHHTKLNGTKYNIKDCKIYSAHEIGKGIYVDDEIFWKKNGQCFYAEYRSYPIISGGKIIGSVINFSDISKRKSKEAQLFSMENRVGDNKSELSKKNITITEILSHLEITKNQLKKSVSTNIDKLLLPLLQKFTKNATRIEKKYITLLEKNIKEMTSELGIQLSDKRLGLSKRELDICNMINGGLSTKEIADLLELSVRTIDTHRQNIRRKLQIVKTNSTIASCFTKV